MKKKNPATTLQQHPKLPATTKAKRSNKDNAIKKH